MAIKVHCPRCRRRLSVADDAAGSRLDCPSCEEPFEVPDPSSGSAPPAIPHLFHNTAAVLTVMAVVVIVTCVALLTYLALGVPVRPNG